MALGVRERLGARHGLATTGVAGPTAQDGQPVGRVHLAHAGELGVEVETWDLVGDRALIRAQAVERALALLLRRL